jgi:hypothetical protein
VYLVILILTTLMQPFNLTIEATKPRRIFLNISPPVLQRGLSPVRGCFPILHVKMLDPSSIAPLWLVDSHNWVLANVQVGRAQDIIIY